MFKLLSDAFGPRGVVTILTGAANRPGSITAPAQPAPAPYVAPGYSEGAFGLTLEQMALGGMVTFGLITVLIFALDD